VGSGIGAWVIWANGSSTLPTSVTDSSSQTYSYSGINIYNNNTSLNLALYTLNSNAHASALVITATWASAQTYLGVWAFEVQGTSGYQTGIGNSQDAPGAGASAITSTATSPLSQPNLQHAICVDAAGNALSTPSGGLTPGTNGLLLSGNSAASGVSGYQRLTNTGSIAATFGNATDAAASFLTGQSFWTETSSSTPTTSPIYYRRNVLYFI
jgi:hypothetical protein